MRTGVPHRRLRLRLALPVGEGGIVAALDVLADRAQAVPGDLGRILDDPEVVHRLTARLPMLTPPHAAGDLGAVRVEARGAGPAGERLTLIAGASGPTGELAAAVAAAAALRLAEVGAPAGAHPLAADAVTQLDLLHHAARLGVTVQEFTGVARATHW